MQDSGMEKRDNPQRAEMMGVLWVASTCGVENGPLFTDCSAIVGALEESSFGFQYHQMV